MTLKLFSKQFLNQLSEEVERHGPIFFVSFMSRCSFPNSERAVIEDCDGGCVGCECPFCDTWSFSFFNHRYYCYECGALGDPVAFLMTTRHCSFDQAVETLAIWLGLPIIEADKAESERMGTEARKIREERMEEARKMAFDRLKPPSMDETKSEAFRRMMDTGSFEKVYRWIVDSKDIRSNNKGE